ncbi:hypothetical protein [Micromonospora noduli]|uniref:hypothetical protein n=1 Tax=Micromonospora noduli TaxID=709876 RepID=UPI0011BE3563|nr:hypothetical protein [Micromonospora noduli]
MAYIRVHAIHHPQVAADPKNFKKLGGSGPTGDSRSSGVDHLLGPVLLDQARQMIRRVPRQVSTIRIGSTRLSVGRLGRRRAV